MFAEEFKSISLFNYVSFCNSCIKLLYMQSHEFYHQLFLCRHLMLKITIQILLLIPSTKKVLKDKLYIYASGWETLTSEHQEYVQFLNNTSLYIFNHDKTFSR